jgi:folate-dependent phosphoribosylglycinamide formyltransferase PurN
MSKPWVAFFSQTGSEIANIAESIGRWPDLIITNKRPEHLRTIDERITKYGYITTKNKPTVNDLELLLANIDNPIITLHGWLRIMPKELCEKYSIYNGHPGLITWYPELKGKDPQVRAYEGIQEGKYVSAGVVLHKVIPEVDEGKILAEEYFGVDKSMSLDDLFRILKDRSLYTWINFLRKVL